MCTRVFVYTRIMACVRVCCVRTVLNCLSRILPALTRQAPYPPRVLPDCRLLSIQDNGVCCMLWKHEYLQM